MRRSSSTLLFWQAMAAPSRRRYGGSLKVRCQTETKKEESAPFPNFKGPGSELIADDKRRLDLLKPLVNKDGRIIFNSCNEDRGTDPAKLKAHIADMRKKMQMMADYTGREIWAYPQETHGMMIPRGEGSSTWLKVKPK